MPISAARVPVTMTCATCGTSSSKSTSQIHDTSRPSAIRSFSATTSVLRAGSAASVRITSFAPAGFLISSTSAGRPSRSIRSPRPNAAENRPSPSATVAAGIPWAWPIAAAARAL
jgi:hypothetical protein